VGVRTHELTSSIFSHTLRWECGEKEAEKRQKEMQKRRERDEEAARKKCKRGEKEMKKRQERNEDGERAQVAVGMRRERDGDKEHEGQ